MLVIGIDPSSKAQGVAASCDGAIVMAKSSELIVTPLDCFIALSKIAKKYNHVYSEVMVAVEEWGAFSGTNKDGKKFTNHRSILLLERSGQNWIAAACILGMQTSRVNISTWHGHFHIKHYKKGTGPSTKEQSVSTVERLYGVKCDADAADAALIAKFSESSISQSLGTLFHLQGQ